MIWEKIQEMIKNAVEAAIDSRLEGAYKVGWDAGYTSRELEDHKDEERRLSQCLEYGYNKGAEDAYAKLGVIDIDAAMKEAMEEVKEEAAV